jgi:hypothetical protein
MAKDKLTEYSATNASNDVIGDISVAEGMLPSAVNNALREQMTHLKNFSDGTDAIDALAVDNLKLDGNTISSTDTNGNVQIDPAGTGNTIIASGNLNISTVGAIGIADGDNLYIASDDTNDVGLKFNGDGNRIQPCDASGASRDNAIDLGEAGSSRFKDLYLGGVVQIEGSTRSFKIEQNNYGLRICDVSAGSAERLRINAAGQLLLNTTSEVGSQVTFECGNREGVRILHNSGSTQYPMAFRNGDNTVGSISTSTTNTSYNTSSDHRLKENVTYDWDATTRLKQLKPARFNFIADADTTVDGFLAHEAQAVVPEAVTGTKDAMRDEEYEITPAVLDDDGNEVTPAEMGTRSVPDYQGIDQAKIVPLLTKALIESVEKIEQLEARITALEA